MSYQNIKVNIKLLHSNQSMYKFLEKFIDKFCDINDKNFRTFHYFIEKDILEIRIDHKDDERINSWTKEYFKDIDSIKFEEYNPEIYNFEDGWWMAEKIFEYCARASVHIRNSRSKNLFRESKFIHCFLNQLGYDSLSEASFHNFTAGQMLIKYYRELEQNI